MAKRGRGRQPAGWSDPARWPEPEGPLSFIELRPFTRRWHQLKLSDLDLQALQITIMTRPDVGTVI